MVNIAMKRDGLDINIGVLDIYGFEIFMVRLFPFLAILL